MEEICLNCLLPLSECLCAQPIAGKTKKKSPKGKKVQIEYRLKNKEKWGIEYHDILPVDWTDYFVKYATEKDAFKAVNSMNKSNSTFEYRMKE